MALTVLLTGAGGVALPMLINGLRDRDYRVVAVDADKNASGLYSADRAYQVPFAVDPEFTSVLRRICRAEHVDAIVPLVDEELVPLAQLAIELDIPAIGPRVAFTKLCLDKYALMQCMAEQGLAVPETRLLNAGVENMEFPLILKPRTGRGSRGIKIVRDRGELDEYCAVAQPNGNATIVQPFVAGVEFTISVVVWRDGQVRAVVPKEVIDKRGVTRIAITRRHAVIDRLCRDIQTRLSADGPFNVQLRIDPVSGTPLPFEINPRFSTTVTLTQAAGVDELGSIVDLALGRAVPARAWDWREGVTLIRQTRDAFLDVDDYTSRRDQLDTLR